MNECLTTPQHKNKSAIGCQMGLVGSIYLFCLFSDIFCFDVGDFCCGVF